MINTLLIFKDEALKQTATKALQDYYRDQVKVQVLPSLQDAIEQFEADKTIFDLVLFEQTTTSLTMVKMLLPLGNGAKFLMCSDLQIDLAPFQGEFTIDRVPAGTLGAELSKLIKKFEVLGHLPPVAGVTEEYVSVKPEVMLSYCPLNYNVFIKMSDGRFVKLFSKGDPVGKEDFEKFRREKGIGLFYFKKSEYQEVLEQSVSKIEKISNEVPLPEEKAVKEAVQANAAVRDIVAQMGFTPQAQMIARSSVAMTAKIIGTKPKLSKILSDLKKKEGSYVSNHSIAVGTLACAIAYRLEWQSAATYFKLSLAAFMHDITLDDKLAKVNFLKDADKSKFSPEEINKIKLHPVHAADYVRKMTEIPADVDQIVFQHHERPDGTGFPRALGVKYISPLTCVFIAAHDIVEFLDAREGETIAAFLWENEELYKNGTFRKIWLALKADIK